MTAKIARPTTARIRPLPPEDRDPESKALIDSIGSSSTDNTFNTLARHPSLLRAWMPFAAGILVEGQLPARVRELAILRTGWNCRSEYEFGQHAVLARKVGVSDEDIVRVQSGPNAEGWTELESAMLRAADELHADACITDETLGDACRAPRRPPAHRGAGARRRRTPSMPRRNTAASPETSTATTESPAPQRRSSDPGLNHVELICGIDCVKRVRTWLDPDQADGESPPRKERPTSGRLDRLRRHSRRFIANPVPWSPARGAPTSPSTKERNTQ